MDIKLEYLFQSVEFVTGINRVKLTAQTRAREVVDARRIYCSLAREWSPRAAAKRAKAVLALPVSMALVVDSKTCRAMEWALSI